MKNKCTFCTTEFKSSLEDAYLRISDLTKPGVPEIRRANSPEYGVNLVAFSFG